MFRFKLAGWTFGFPGFPGVFGWKFILRSGFVNFACRYFAPKPVQRYRITQEFRGHMLGYELILNHFSTIQSLILNHADTNTEIVYIYK